MLLAGLVWLVQRVRGGLVYDWDWASVWGFVVYTDPRSGASGPGLLLQGLLVTVRVSIWSAVIAAAAGLAIGLARASRTPFWQALGWVYVELVRNVPPLVFLFVFYFFVTSQLLPPLRLPQAAAALPETPRALLTLLLGPPELLENTLAGIIALALLEAAFVAEIVRGGIASIGKGQSEAARALGLSRWLTMRLVVLPQAIRNTLPPLGSQFISLVKDSSIVSLISIQELTFMTAQAAVSSRRTFELWLVTAGLYLAICLALALLFRRLERRRQP